MDGNHSAKHLDGLDCYFIPVSTVEQFRDDVCNWLGEHLTRENITCTKKWTAAKSVEEDKISVFEQTGIFILACQHGFMECIAEMKHSGELAKYGLAAMNWLLEVCGQDQGLGHDIGCSLHKTIAASSIGNLATKLNLIVAVNAFHGYAHNCQCQLHHHPLYLQGFGHFLHDNYVQALSIIEEHTRLLDEFMTQKSITNDDFVRWQQEESDFLSNLATELPSDAIAVAYIEELKMLHVAESTYGSMTSVPYLTYTPASFTASSGLNTSIHQQSRAVEAQRLSALRQYQLQMNIVKDFEQRHDITEHWTPMHHEYTPALEYSHERHFVRIVEELEGLVIQHLFDHANSLQGYKMCKYILKAIAHCSATILPETQEMSAKYFKLVWSHEEITHLNVEIGRLEAWTLVTDDPSSLLAAELRKQYSICHRINNVHRCCLHKIHQLKGYSGPIPVMQHDVTEEGRDDEGSGDPEENDELGDEASRLEDTISCIQ
ncbi:hypothetical protein BD769DRAFT_1631985 [Suillus cothurnatus]|nr:hypothetical protein BD769DRAFT_1631985 [Suillus cothurnatus]